MLSRLGWPVSLHIAQLEVEADVARHAGRWQEALATQRVELDLRCEASGDDSPSCAWGHLVVGQGLVDDGEIDDGLAEVERSAWMYRAALGETHPEQVYARSYLGAALIRLGASFVDGRGEIRHWTRETCTPDELAAIQCGLGCLGLVYELTLEVEPRYETLHEARCIPYEQLFADTDEARRALADLHETHASIEFFWWPLRFSGLPLLSAPEVNPEVWVLSTRDVPAGARPRGPIRRFFHLNFVDMASMIFSGLSFLSARGRWFEPWLLLWSTCFTNLWVDARSGAWTMPQYDANHFVNAGGVEFVRAVAAEWSVPFDRRAPVDAAHGYERLRRCFATLHDLVVEAFHAHPASDPRAAPIALAVEMRALRTSTALLSPGYNPDRELAIAAPELVTTAGHPAWDEFVARAHLAMTTQPEIFGEEVRCHLAKPMHHLPHPRGGTAAYMREQYRAAGTWERFLDVREALDPDGVFLNDYLRRWFFHP